MWKQLAAGVVTAAVLGTGSLAVAGALSGHDSSRAAASYDLTAATQHPTSTAGRGLLAGAMKVAAQTIDIDVNDLRDAIAGGQTVAAVATAHGVDPQRVVDALVQAADARIDQAEQAGRIDAERAAKLKARAPKAADRVVRETQQVLGAFRARLARHALRAAGLQAAAGAIGISTTDLRHELANGHSIADVAAAHHVDLTKVEGAMTDAAKQTLTAAVQAGRITAKRAERIESRLSDLVDRLAHKHFHGHAAAGTTPSA